jgi:outer membrane receptor protein involved in Fe transport
LALAPEQLFSFGAMRGDVCAWGNTQAHSVNPVQNPNNWQNVLNICGQMMEAAAIDADDQFYGLDYRLISPTNPPTVNPTSPGGGGAFPHIIGNPDVSPEIADTWTVGIVANSPWEDNEWLADLRVTLDWYTIEVNDAIGEQTADVVMQMCVDPRFNPTYNPNSPYCGGFTRTTTGAVVDMTLSFVNTGWFSTSGIDLSINWGKKVGPGRLGVYTLFNYLLNKKATDFLGVNQIRDYTGASGPYSNGLFGASYKYQALTTVSYNINDLNLAIRWSYFDKLHGGDWITRGWDRYTPTPRYMLFDLTGSYNLTETMMLRFGVENVFNKEPLLTGVLYTAADGMYGGGFDYANTDVNGRRFYLGARLGF